jgi:transcriptional regulator with XRE-family HTH domain
VPQPTLAQLGTAIRSLREEREMTSEGLAHETGLHRFSVYRIEGGKQNLTWSALANIATALDVELVDLVKRATEQSKSRSQDERGSALP